MLTAISENKEQYMQYENNDLDTITTPVDAVKFGQLLQQSGYEHDKIHYLVEGFSNGFSLEVEGELNGQFTSANLKLEIGSKTELWNKVMSEVRDGRFAGPFKKPPFEHFIQSPIGLVPKDNGTKTRLIFHLSHLRSGKYRSVNAGIPQSKCTVKYPDFQDAIKLCLQAGVKCNISKSDISRAFRNCLMRIQDFKFLLMKAKHPKTGEMFYFVDKCLPFGSSISCAIFQKVSNAISHLVKWKTGKTNVNYLDDFLFAALLKAICDGQVEAFIQICAELGFPVAIEKTCWSSTLMTFLGLLIDTERQLICIPIDKLKMAREWIEFFINKRNKKATVLQFQQLCGYLNFLCRCIVPGRTFVQRLYMTNGKLKQHHHVNITSEHRADLKVWKTFLSYPDVFNRSFLELSVLTAEEIDLFSDASKNPRLGYGGHCGPEWIVGQWDYHFIVENDPNIAFLELYAVAIGVLKWLRLFKNRKVLLFCDNMSVVHMVNEMTSKCGHCMKLICLIVLEALLWNVKLGAKYVNTKLNGKADTLSRLDVNRFRRISTNMNDQPSSIPEELLPIQKVW